MPNEQSPPRSDLATGWSQLVSQICKVCPALSSESAYELALASCSLKSLVSRLDHGEAALQWLGSLRDPLWRFLVDEVFHSSSINQAIDRATNELNLPTADPHAYLMHWVHAIEGGKKRGVYYTPLPVARYVIRSALNQLSATGVDMNKLRILEPSVGSGIFISGLMAELTHPLSTNLPNLSCLERTTCIDISPAAIVIARLLLAEKLLALKLANDVPIPEFLAGNPLTAEAHPIYEELEIPNANFEFATRERHYHLIVGNPPFNALAASSDPWITDLLHGRLESPAGQRDYFAVGQGGKIKEKKSWLHDDYVKFLRYAHWQAERSEVGCLALILNSGFARNLGFAGLRFQLDDTFQQLEVVDFGGDKRNLRNPTDENLFEIGTGIASLVCTQGSNGPENNKRWTGLEGNRKAKLSWCLDPMTPDSDLNIETFDLSLFPPHFRFDRRPTKELTEFDAGLSLDEIYKNKYSVPVTARDHLVTDWTPEQLTQKIESFLDPTHSDDFVRETMFPPARSQRYPRGDTRSWKLSEVRKELRSDNWKSYIRACSYRPFDRRSILWHPTMIDWPRPALADALRHPNNFCLIARKQAPDTANYSYFWSAREIPIDGILRSDNRGNEYCYPSYYDERGVPESNIHSWLIRHLGERWQQPALEPNGVSFLIQAIFHSTEYRNRFQKPLLDHTPRVFFPKDKTVALALADLGRQIIELQCGSIAPPVDPSGKPLNRNSTQRLYYRDGKLTISKDVNLDVPEDIWAFEIGSHQLIKKYCAYRLRAGLVDGLSDSVMQLGDRIKQLRSLTQEIDDAIATSGGFDHVFDLNPKFDRSHS